MKRLLRALLLCFTGCLTSGWAAESCPWLNAATAGGVLGTAVTLSVTHETANRDDVVCTFAANGAELRIDVQTMDTPRTGFTDHAAQCMSNRAVLNAIGNEAVLCNEAHFAQVVGRVRNRIFTITVSGRDGSAAAESLREKARTVAGHVAGNLF